jgi:uncharacterized protein YggU (UPF0235/DUF167 family)
MIETLFIKVKPNARENKLEKQLDGTWLAHVKAVPVDGKANKNLIALVAQTFGVHKAQVCIKTGTGAKFKKIEILALS